MPFHIKNHLLEEVEFRNSPHYDDRPEGVSINLLVLHNISLPPNEYGGDYIDQLFLGKLKTSEHPYFVQIQHLKVSAHVLIRRDGEVLQYVPFDKRAWHAGESSFAGCSACNDFSIGIELEGTDVDPYEEIQYKKLTEITVEIQRQYQDISMERITGHSDIAPGRKTDPGVSFNWPYYFKLVQAELG